MTGKRYTTDEITLLLFEFKLGTPLSELEIKLGRTSAGIFEKIKALSKADSSTWDKERVIEYRRGWRRQWYQNHKTEERTRLKIYRQQHRSKERKRYRRWYHKRGGRKWRRQWYQQHRDSISKSRKTYREKNRGIWKEFGNYLAGLLASYDGGKKQFAQELGINPSLMSPYLAGNRKPPEKLLRAVSERFGRDYEQLKYLALSSS